MPNRVLEYRTTVLTNAAESANNTETVVCTLSGISCEYDGSTIRLHGWLKASVGTGTTAGLMRLRRDSLTGLSLSEPTAETGPFVASKVCDGTVDFDDVSRTIAGGVYVLTYQGTGDTAVTTFLAASLTAEIF